MNNNHLYGRTVATNHYSSDTQAAKSAFLNSMKMAQKPLFLVAAAMLMLIFFTGTAHAGTTSTTTTTLSTTSTTTTLSLSVTASASPTSIHADQLSTLSGSATGGTGTVSYQWYMEAPGASSYTSISGATSTSYVFNVLTLGTPTGGIYNFKLQATDSASTPAVANSPEVSVTVNPMFANPVKLVDVIAPITNNPDSGNHDVWALDTISRHITAYQTGLHSYRMNFSDTGTAYTYAGVNSPGSANIPEPYNGAIPFTGYANMTFNGTFTPGSNPVTGTLSNFDNQGTIDDLFNNSYGASVSTFGHYINMYFTPTGSSSNYSLHGWGWTYIYSTYPSQGQTWVDSYYYVVSPGTYPDGKGDVVTYQVPTVTMSAPSNTVLDSSQYEVYSATVYNGIGPFTVGLYQNGNPTPIETNTLSNDGSVTFTAFQPVVGTDTYHVSVLDNGETAGAVGPANYRFNSSSSTVTVDNAPSDTAPNPSNSLLDNGQYETFNTMVSNGAGPFTVNLVYTNNGVVAESLTNQNDGLVTFPTLQLHGLSETTDSFNVMSTDMGTTTPFTFSSKPTKPIVNTTLQMPNISTDNSPLDLGQYGYITCNNCDVAGLKGQPGYTYQWLIGFDANTPTVSEGNLLCGASATNSMCDFNTSGLNLQPGTYNVILQVTDSASTPETNNSLVLHMIVNPVLNKPSIQPPNPTVTEGNPLTFSATETGGTQTGGFAYPLLSNTIGYVFVWYVNGQQLYCNNGLITCLSSGNVQNYSINFNSNYSMYNESPDNITVVAFDGSQGVPTNSVNTCQPLLNYLSGAFGSILYDYCNTQGNLNFSSTSVQVNKAVFARKLVPADQNPIYLDSGQHITFYENAYGGTGYLNYLWYLNGYSNANLIGGSASLQSNSIVFYANASTEANSIGSANDMVNVCVYDTLAAYCVRNSSNPIHVFPIPRKPTISNKTTVISADQQFVLTANVIGGTGNFLYTWYDNGNVITSCGGSSNTCTYNGLNFTPGMHDISVMVADVGTDVNATPQPITNVSLSDAATVNVYAMLSSVSISNTSSTISADQAITFTATAVGGTGTDSYTWYNNGTAITGCTDLTTNTCTIPANTFTGYKTGTEHNISVTVVDTGTSKWANPPENVSSTNATLTVYPVLGIPTVTTTSAVISADQKLVLQAIATGGTGSYAYTWYNNGTAIKTCANLSSNTCTLPANFFTGSSTGQEHNISVTVVDTGTSAGAFPPENVSSANTTVTVYTSLGVPTVSNMTAVISADQAITFTATPTGGTGSYGYTWYDNGSVIGTCTTATCTFPVNYFTGSAAGTLHNVSVNVIDTGTYAVCFEEPTTADWTCTQPGPQENASSTNATLTVFTSLGVPTISHTESVISADQAITFTATPTGGTGTYSYTWYNNGTAITDCTALSTNTCTIPANTYSGSSTGQEHNISVTVVDTGTSAGAMPPENASSTNATLTVYPTLSTYYITPVNATISQDQKIIIRVRVLGGSGVYSYTWYDGTNVVSSCTEASSTSTESYCTFPVNSLSVGNHTITAHVVDIGTSSWATPTENVTSSPSNVTVYPSLGTPILNHTTSVISADQAVNFTATVSGGTGSYGYTWYDNGSVIETCTTATCTFPAGYFTGSPSGTEHNVSVTVVDTGTGCTSPSITADWHCITPSPQENASSTNATLTVYPVLGIPTVTTTSAVISADQKLVLQAVATGGTGTYAYTWYNNGTAIKTCANLSSNTCTLPVNYFTGSSAGTLHNVSVNVTDTGTSSWANPPENMTSANTTVTVYTALGTPIVSNTTSVISADQKITFTATVTGGTGSYGYTWYDNGTALGTTTSNTFIIPAHTYTGSATGTLHNISVTVVDTGTYAACFEEPVTAETTCTQPTPQENASSTNATLTIYPVLGTPTLSITSAVISADQNVVINATETGGTGTYSYTWYDNGTEIVGCTSLTTNTCTIPKNTYTGSSEGTLHNIVVNVTDTGTSAGAMPPENATSQATAITVYTSLGVPTVSNTTSVISADQAITYTAAVSGGTGTDSFTWYDNGTAITDCTALSTNTCTIPANTYSGSSTGQEHNISVTVKDTGTTLMTPQENQSSTNATLTVYPVLGTPTLSPGSAIISADQKVVINATVSGGTGSYSYTWYDNGSVIETCTTATCTFPVNYFDGSATGTLHNVSVSVVDTGTSAGATPTENATSANTIITVFTPLGVPAINHTQSVISQDQALTLVATVSGGTGTDSYTWYDGSTAITACTGLAVSTCVIPKGSLSVGLHNVSVTVVDVGTTNATPLENQTSANVSVNVTASLEVPTINHTQSVISQDQALTLTANVIGGTGSVAYTWYDGSSVLSSCNNSTTCTFPQNSLSVGSHSITVHVADTGTSAWAAPQENQTSDVATIQVYASLGAPVISPSNPTIDNGTSIMLNASVTGGTNHTAYQWYVNGNAVGNSTAHYLFHGNTSTNATVFNNVSVHAVDTGTSAWAYPPENTTSNTTVKVNPKLKPINVSVSGGFYDQGETVTLTSTQAMGGTPPYHYTFVITNTSTSQTFFVCTNVSLQFCTFSATQLGTYYANVIVTDSATVPGSINSTNPANFTVNPNFDLIGNRFARMLVNTTHTYLGNSVLLTANTLGGGSKPYKYIFSIYNATTGAQVGSSITEISNSIANSIVYTPPANGLYFANAVIYDSATPSEVMHSGDSYVFSVGNIVAPTLIMTPAKFALDNGQTETFTIQVFGGVGPFDVQLYNVTSGAPQVGVSNIIIPSSPGNATFTLTMYTGSSSSEFTYNAIATDTYNNTVFNSTKSNIIVNPPLTDGVSINRTSLDVGQNLNITEGINGGTMNYTYDFVVYNSTGAVVFTTGNNVVSNALNDSYILNTLTDLNSKTGVFTTNVIVNDSAGETTNSPTLSFMVYSAPVVTVAPNALSVDVGNMVTLKANVTNAGSGNDMYQWYLGSNAITGQTASSYTTKANANGTFVYHVVVTDSNGGTGVSNNAIVTVTGTMPNVTIPANLTVNTGSSISLSGTVKGGTGPYAYQWYNDTSGTPSTVPNALGGNTLTLSTTSGSSAGSFTYYLVVTDSNNATAQSNNAVVTVNKPASSSGSSSGGGGGSSGTGGGGGSAPGGGGSSKPTVVPYNTTSVHGWTVLNFTQDNSENVKINGKSFDITLNSISPTLVDITVNGYAYTLYVNQPVSLVGLSNYTLNLDSISYLPILDTAVVRISGPNAQANQTNSTATTTNTTTNNTATTVATTAPTTVATTTVAPGSSTVAPTTTASAPPASTTELGAGIIVAILAIISAMYFYMKSGGKKKKWR